MTTSFVTLFKNFVAGMTDYMTKHNANYATIEDKLNYILSMLTGQAGGDLSVPVGLQEIFDRAGIIGIGSYDFAEGALSGPSYNLGVNAGAYWSGANFLHKATSTTLSLAGRATGTWYVYLDGSGTPALSDVVKEDTIRQFHWDSGSHVVSNKALYQGISVLFDGDDYADCLDSATRDRTFTRLADRLEEIEQLLGAMTGFYSLDHAEGLNFHYRGGKVRNDSVITVSPDGHVTLADNATNYVEVDPNTGTVTRNTTGFTSGWIPLFQIATANGAITTITDVRTWAVAGTGGGGGGGHTQNTDVGTTAEEFEIDRDASGTPSGRAGLKVNNGDDPAGHLKYNRDSKRWEYSNDGGDSWWALGEVDLSLAAQQFTRYVPRDDPPLVYSEVERGSTPGLDYEGIDLSSHLGDPQFGVNAVVLRVFFKDAALGIGTKVMFKKGGGAASPATAFTVWSDESDAEQKAANIILPLGDAKTIEFFLFASGPNTAGLAVYLLGFFEEVMGVGTQEKTISQANIEVPAGAALDLTIEAFCNRGLVHYFKIDETGGQAANIYDVHLYADPDFTVLLYKVENIVPGTPFEDFLPFWIYDQLAGRNLRVRIINHDALNPGVYALGVKAEQFA
ncbi:MAG: hypothetical protein PHU44_14955 [Syntrophales bacterium]|nr:hypothetical protein [Syntrophales bacterium]MDD5640410.1 hypothetical protein [Syntrophales bacterium]